MKISSPKYIPLFSFNGKYDFYFLFFTNKIKYSVLKRNFCENIQVLKINFRISAKTIEIGVEISLKNELKENGQIVFNDFEF